MRLFSRNPDGAPRTPLFSPRGFVQWAAVFAAMFLLAHAAGLREFTSILNGTSGSTAISWNTAAFLGVVYVLLYLGFVLIAPTLILAAILLRIGRRIVGRMHSNRIHPAESNRGLQRGRLPVEETGDCAK